MAEKINATCSICGNGYHMCLSCKDMAKMRPWQIHTDTSEHYKVYQILHGYTIGVYSKDEAKEKLNNVDLSDMNDYVVSVKNALNEILSNDVDKKETNKVVDDGVSTDIVKNDIEEVKDKKTVSKRKSKVVKTEV